MFEIVCQKYKIFIIVRQQISWRLRLLLHTAHTVHSTHCTHSTHLTHCMPYYSICNTCPRFLCFSLSLLGAASNNSLTSVEFFLTGLHALFKVTFIVSSINMCIQYSAISSICPHIYCTSNHTYF